MDLASASGSAAEAPRSRLLPWILSRAEQELGESHWRSRALSAAQGALAAWEASPESGPAEDFFEWAIDLDQLSLWMERHGSLKAAAGLRMYLASLPGYGATPKSPTPYEQHGYVGGLIFGGCESERLFVKRAIAEPELMEALAPAGFKAFEWPQSEARALEGLSLMEAAALERGLGSGRLSLGESRRL